MSVIVEIPTPLRRFTEEEREVVVTGGTVHESLRAAVERHPSLERHLYTEDGKLRSFVNVFVNDDDIRHLKQGSTPVADGDRVVIIPSIAGGAQ